MRQAKMPLIVVSRELYTAAETTAFQRQTASAAIRLISGPGDSGFCCSHTNSSEGSSNTEKNYMFYQQLGKIMNFRFFVYSPNGTVGMSFLVQQTEELLY
jgi:hypothetical protein